MAWARRLLGGGGVLAEPLDVDAEAADVDGNTIGGETLRDVLETMAIVESRFDLGPEASDLSSLGPRLFLAQSGEAGAGVLAHGD